VIIVPAPAPPVPKPPLQPRLQQVLAAAPDIPHSTSTTTPDEEEDEVASVKRVPAVTLQLWETLLKPRGFEINGGKLIRSPTKSQAGKGGADGDVEVSPLGAKTRNSKGKEREREVDGNGSVIASFRRVNSFAAPAAVHSVARQPFRRISSIIEPEPNASAGASGSQNESRSRSTPQDNAAGPSKTTAASVSESAKLLFSGLKFRALGEAKCLAVKTEIEGCGGWMVSELEDDVGVDFVIVRLVRYAVLHYPLPYSIVEIDDDL
jgi:DNA replication regulator DPB11